MHLIYLKKLSSKVYQHLGAAICWDKIPIHRLLKIAVGTKKSAEVHHVMGIRNVLLKPNSHTLWDNWIIQEFECNFLGWTTNGKCTPEALPIPFRHSVCGLDQSTVNPLRHAPWSRCILTASYFAFQSTSTTLFANIDMDYETYLQSCNLLEHH